MEATNTNTNTTSETIRINIIAEIRSANDLFESKFAAGDAAGLADLYTEDGMLLPAGIDIIKGRKGIESFWQNIMDMNIKQARLQTIEVEHLNNTAIELGYYTLSGKGGLEMDKGKYVVIWKRDQGQWRLQKDIWTTSLAQH